jgi:carbamoyl-phosphate synthase large subunit
MMDKIKVLITGGGAPGAAGIIKCLRERKDLFLISGDKNEDAYGKYLTDDFVQLPDALHKDFCSFVLAYCKKQEVKIVLPLVTKELGPFSLAKSLFKQAGITVLVSDYNSLQTANDKGYLYQSLMESEIRVPEFRRVNDWFDMHKAIQDLGYPHKEVVIKPCVSNGLRGFRIIKPDLNEKELLLNHKPDNSYITLEKLQQIFARDSMPDYVVCEYLPGEEFTVDVLAQNGNSLQIVPRLRTTMTGGISTRGELVNQLEIKEYVKKIINHLKLNWLIGVQVKKAVDGSYKILEINPRVQGTTVACLGGGINFPLLAVNLALEGDFEYKEPQWGVKFLRHWQEIYY